MIIGEKEKSKTKNLDEEQKTAVANHEEECGLNNLQVIEESERNFAKMVKGETMDKLVQDLENELKTKGDEHFIMSKLSNITDIPADYLPNIVIFL